MESFLDLLKSRRQNFRLQANMKTYQALYKIRIFGCNIFRTNVLLYCTFIFSHAIIFVAWRFADRERLK